MSETVVVQEFLYDAVIQLADVIDFGIDLESLAMGRAQIPPQGLRFDTIFQGEFTGPKLKGKLAGTDYWTWRPDGVGLVHVHTVLTTADGDRIAYHATGAFKGEAGSMVFQLRENIGFHTAAAQHDWVNRLQGWGTGTIDMTVRKLVMKVYAA
jgi:hypothetical protein